MNLKKMEELLHELQESGDSVTNNERRNNLGKYNGALEIHNLTKVVNFHIKNEHKCFEAATTRKLETT